MSDNSNNSKKLDVILQKDPSAVDIRLSWFMLKRNFKPYLSIAVFSVITTFLVIFGLAILGAIIAINLIGLNINDYPNLIPTLSTIIMIPTFLLLAAFNEGGYGVAYDIMSTESEFTQFKGAFPYFKKYWWQYTVLSLFYNFLILLVNPVFLELPFTDSIVLKLGIYIILNIFGYFWFVIAGTSLPAITAHGNLRKAVKESFTLFKKNPLRFWKTWWKFYLAFYLIPVFIPIGVYTIIDTPATEAGKIILTTIYILAQIFTYLISTPMTTLVRTRLYNSLTQTEK